MREEILQSEAVAEPALFWDSLKTGILVLVIGLFGFWNGNVLLIPSLAPSAIYQVLRPDLPSSRCSNLILGHVIGIFAALVSLGIFNAQNDPSILVASTASLNRIWASALAVAMTVFLQRAARNFHPPAAATVLLLTTGALQSRWSNVRELLSGLLLMTLVAEIFRRFQNSRVRQPPR